jgi:hypothetical protein
MAFKFGVIGAVIGAVVGGLYWIILKDKQQEKGC